MDTISESLLSAELQELYLQNKEWMSQLLFMDDEERFFQHLFTKKWLVVNEHNEPKQIEQISENLSWLKKSTVQLKNLVVAHQHSLETVFKDPAQFIGILLIEEHARINQKIKELLFLNRTLKTELFAMIEGEKPC